MSSPVDESPERARMLSEQAHARLAAAEPALVHVVAIATKPDIIKQYPVAKELEKRGELVVVCHTNQHYDYRYSGGMLEEFDLTVDVHLGIKGDLAERTAQIVSGVGALIAEIRALGHTPVPYIHGDTATSMAVSVGSYLNRVACVHVEAGIRTITPRAEVLRDFLADHAAGRFDVRAYAKVMRERATYELGSREPFPEQFNTRVSDAGTGYHAAPVELDREFLLAEGFPPDTIEVVGNTVADATAAAVADAANVTIFDTYPQLQDGQFIRICIHRRENTEDEARFTILFEAIEQLLERGRSVLFIRLFGTDLAIDKFGLRERLEGLVASYPDTFISSEVWANYRDVVAAMQRCALVATDSGSMQEEMSYLRIPTVTLRFGTDRGETLLAGHNLLAPPTDPGLVADICEAVLDDDLLDFVSESDLYGRDVSAKIVDGVLARATLSDGLFRAEEARLGLVPPA